MSPSRRLVLMGGLAGGACAWSRPAMSRDAPEPRLSGPGSGEFQVPGGPGREHRAIRVVYHRPRGFTQTSPILLVLPGGGRRAGLYRDSWVEASERHGVLVAALGYPARHYDFAAYQLGGLVKNLRVLGRPLADEADLPRRTRLNDSDVTWDVEPRRQAWIFGDLDRIFGVLARAAGSRRTGYDVFGHSGGAQLAHRFAIFHPRSRADRIVAANAGLYTLPTPDDPLIYGLAGSRLGRADLAAALSARLAVLVGEKDNDPDHGDPHLHTPTADQQGLGRRTRGRAFFSAARDAARRAGLPLNWTLEVIPRVGHDYARMGQAAARRLYG